jgi:hypothetical protein
MQCPSCNKFPSKDTDTEPEGDLDVDEHGMVTGDVRIVNTSECCGDELEETTFTVEIDLTEQVEAHLRAKHAGYLAERDKPKPKVKDKPIPWGSVDRFDRCRTCGKYFMSHFVTIRGRDHTVDARKVKMPTDARKAKCRLDRFERMRKRITEADAHFVPAPKHEKTPAKRDANAAPSFSVETEMSRTDEMQRTDRKGRPIKRSRYMKRLYGIEVEATVTCDDCGETIATGNFSDHVQASGMDSLV